MEVDEKAGQEKAQSESESSDSETETSSSCSSYSDDDDYFSPLGPDGLPWGTKPYQFEPLAKDCEHSVEEASSLSKQIDYESRLTNLDWYVNDTHKFLSFNFQYVKCKTSLAY